MEVVVTRLVSTVPLKRRVTVTNSYIFGLSKRTTVYGVKDGRTSILLPIYSFDWYLVDD